MNANTRMELWERCIDVWKETAEARAVPAPKIDALGMKLFLLPDGSGETTAAHASTREQRDGKCLYYAPEQAFLGDVRVNRTNTTTMGQLARGYTEEELSCFTIGHRGIPFDKWPSREEHLADRQNWHFTPNKQVYIKVLTQHQLIDIAEVRAGLEQEREKFWFDAVKLALHEGREEVGSPTPARAEIERALGKIDQLLERWSKIAAGFALSDVRSGNDVVEAVTLPDDLPRKLIQPVVALPVGTLRQRLLGVTAWRAALLRGELPSADWPPDEIAAGVLAVLRTPGFLDFFKDEPALVDALLLDIIDAFARQGALRGPGKSSPGPTPVWTPLSEWTERWEQWRRLANLLGPLQQHLKLGWNLTHGVLRLTGWTEIMKLGALFQKLGGYKKVIDSLGRLLDAAPGPQGSTVDRIFKPVARREKKEVEVRSTRVPSEMTGIERSGEFARMLPSEAALLKHPTLRLLWQARWAERALMTYRVEGTEIELIEEDSESMEEVGEQVRRNKGPIVALVDTSGSMMGTPEIEAKALVLAAIRLAREQNRDCLLYAFSGPKEVLELNLSLRDPREADPLLKFLGLSFHGGTDITEPLRRTLQRLKEDTWRNADVLIVSDGEWGPLRQEVRDQVSEAKKGGTRFHGIRVSQRAGEGLRSICDPIHEFQDWGRIIP